MSCALTKEATLVYRYHGTLGVAPSGSGAIDHIFVSNDAKVLFFNLLVDQTVLDASDHVPIYIDVKLTK